MKSLVVRSGLYENATQLQLRIKDETSWLGELSSRMD